MRDLNSDVKYSLCLCDIGHVIQVMKALPLVQYRFIKL